MKYNLKKMIGGVKGTKVRFPIMPESPGLNRSYLAELRKLLHAVAKTTRETIIPAYQRSLTLDVGESEFEMLSRVITALTKSTSETVARLVELESIKHTERFAEAARSAFKIDLSGVIGADDIRKQVEAAALRNASLIKGMTDDLVKKIQMTTTDALIKGETAGQLRKRLKVEFNLSDTRAKLIARDQTSKLNADLNRIRQQQAGIDSYTWRTSRDERVRSRHAKLDGEEFKYGEDTPAENGGEPGEPVQCRCIAQGVIEF